MDKISEYLRKKRWWRLPAFAFIVVSSLLIYLRDKGYTWLDFTGFEGKTVWDVFDLLIIPATLAAVAIILEAFERKSDREIALENQRETILQNYFDAMTRLMLDKNLKGSGPHDEVREIARVKTLTVLKRLDGKRKGDLIRFLSETKLIQKMETNETAQ